MFPGGKGGQCIGLTTLPPSCADCLEIWEPQPPGILRAWPGQASNGFAVTRSLRYLTTAYSIVQRAVSDSFAVKGSKCEPISFIVSACLSSCNDYVICEMTV